MAKELTDEQWIKQNSRLGLEACERRGLCFKCGGKGRLWWVFGGERGVVQCDLCAGDDRLATRSAAWAVDTAHIRLEAPELLAPAPASSYSTPVAAVLQEAHRLLADRGWCRRWLSDGVRACSKGAIQAAARTIGGGHGDQAEEVLLDQIRAEQPAIQSIGAWNDAQTSPAPVLAMFDRAARHADRRGI